MGLWVSHPNFSLWESGRKNREGAVAERRLYTLVLDLGHNRVGSNPNSNIMSRAMNVTKHMFFLLSIVIDTHCHDC